MFWIDERSRQQLGGSKKATHEVDDGGKKTKWPQFFLTLRMNEIIAKCWCFQMPCKAKKTKYEKICTNCKGKKYRRSYNYKKKSNFKVETWLITQQFLYQLQKGLSHYSNTTKQ